MNEYEILQKMLPLLISECEKYLEEDRKEQNEILKKANLNTNLNLPLVDERKANIQVLAVFGLQKPFGGRDQGKDLLCKCEIVNEAGKDVIQVRGRPLVRSAYDPKKPEDSEIFIIGKEVFQIEIDKDTVQFAEYEITHHDVNAGRARAHLKTIDIWSWRDLELGLTHTKGDLTIRFSHKDHRILAHLEEHFQEIERCLNNAELGGNNIEDTLQRIDSRINSALWEFFHKRID